MVPFYVSNFMSASGPLYPTLGWSCQVSTDEGDCTCELHYEDVDMAGFHVGSFQMKAGELMLKVPFLKIKNDVYKACLDSANSGGTSSLVLIRPPLVGEDSKKVSRMVLK